MSHKEKERLFNLYVRPHLKSIKTLTQRYTDNYQDIDENYNHCLTQLYLYIHTYKPEQKLDTWLHIVVKRACFHQNKKRAEESSYLTDITMVSKEDLHGHGQTNMYETTYGSLFDNVSDQVLHALTKIHPLRLSPFLLQAQGMKIREITAAEWDKGHLEKRSEDLVKSRIYWAKKELRYLLRQHGITKHNYQGA